MFLVVSTDEQGDDYEYATQKRHAKIRANPTAIVSRDVGSLALHN